MRLTSVEKLNMFPGTTLNNQAYEPRTNPVIFGEVNGCNVFSGVTVADFKNITFGKFGSPGVFTTCMLVWMFSETVSFAMRYGVGFGNTAMSVAFSLTTFSAFIALVIKSSPKKKMSIVPNTESIITMMADLHTLWYRTIRKFICKTMGAVIFMLVRKPTITIGSNKTSPEPTGVSFSHFRPKTVIYWQVLFTGLVFRGTTLTAKETFTMSYMGQLRGKFSVALKTVALNGGIVLGHMKLTFHVSRLRLLAQRGGFMLLNSSSIVPHLRLKSNYSSVALFTLTFNASGAFTIG